VTPRLPPAAAGQQGMAESNYKHLYSPERQQLSQCRRIQFFGGFRLALFQVRQAATVVLKTAQLFLSQFKNF